MHKRQSLAKPDNGHFDSLMEATLNSFKIGEYEIFETQTRCLLTKPKLLALVESYQPEDLTELMLVLQQVIGFMWMTEKLSRGLKFEPFANLSLRACDLLLRYRTQKFKNVPKNDIPHEQPTLDI